MVVYQAKISSKHKKNSKLGWLASEINFKLLHTGCPSAHVHSNNENILRRPRNNFETCEALCDLPAKLGTCRKFDEICFFVDWLNAVKAFLIIAIVLYLLVIIYLIIMVWGRGMTIRMIGIDLLFAGMSFFVQLVTFHGCPL